MNAWLWHCARLCCSSSSASSSCPQRMNSEAKDFTQTPVKWPGRLSQKHTRVSPRMTPKTSRTNLWKWPRVTNSMWSSKTKEVSRQLSVNTDNSMWAVKCMFLVIQDGGWWRLKTGGWPGFLHPIWRGQMMIMKIMRRFLKKVHIATVFLVPFLTTLHSHYVFPYSVNIIHIAKHYV